MTQCDDVMNVMNLVNSYENSKFKLVRVFNYVNYYNSSSIILKDYAVTRRHSRLLVKSRNVFLIRNTRVLRMSKKKCEDANLRMNCIAFQNFISRQELFNWL